MEELTVMVKSALIFTKAKLLFHIFTDGEDMEKFTSEVKLDLKLFHCVKVLDATREDYIVSKFCVCFTFSGEALAGISQWQGQV